MLLTERKLRKLIKNILLEAPDGLYPQTRDIVLGKYKSDARTSGHYGDSEKVKLIRDILLGLSGPGRVVVDAKDAYNAYAEGEDLDFFIAMAGIIPGVGEAAKLKKLVDAGDKSGAISLLKNAQKTKDSTGKIDAEDLDQVADIVSDSASSAGKVSRTVRGLDNIREALETLIKNDGTVYHLHTINKPEFTDDVLAHGVALRKNRSGGGYRATTYNNDMGAATIDQLRSAPFGIGTNNKVTVIYELPPGKSLKDIVVPFEGVQRDSRYGKFVGNISNEYLKAYVDRRGADDVMKILR